MKYLAWFGGVLITILAAVYIVAFTPFGNGLLKPTIESKIQQQTKLESKLTTFSLNMSEFEIVLELSKNNNISIKGTYSLFSQAFDMTYSVEVKALQELKSLTNAQLKGRVFTNGTIRGDAAFITIDGVSDIAKSDTSYHIELTEFNPTSIIAKVKKANLLSLLELGGQKPYASADIDLDVNFKNITPHALDGDILLQTHKGKIDTKLMKSDFDVVIPRTAFNMNLDAKLKGDDVNYVYKLNSNLAKITSSGTITPQPLTLDVKYGLNIEELAVLKPITNADVRGAFKLNGTAKGTKDNLKVNGKSDVASSETAFNITLKDFKPATVNATVKHLKLQKLLYMVKQPHYTDGNLFLDIDISDARADTLKGLVVSRVENGLLDSKYMSKTYEFKSKMPKTTFNMKTTTKLNGSVADTKVDFNSNLVTLDVKQARFNMKDGSIATDYLVNVKSLERLFFVSQRHLRGGISVNGEFKKAKDLDLTIHSKIAGGKIDATLHNDDFHTDLKSIQTLDALHILMYPEVFKSTLVGTLDYNLAKEKGVMKADLVDGKFTKNQMLTLIKQYAHTDLYKERFKGNVKADIKKENIVASLDLKSNRSSIKTKNTKLNSKTKKINSKIDINANGNPIVITLTGNVTSPKVKIDAEKLIKKEAEKAITKELNNFFKKLF
ncbi:MAG: hypothetical protein J7K14_00615 [Sulfurimonas sp.]|nr:hypothetical protein [Sulfurimonas sp.]